MLRRRRTRTPVEKLGIGHLDATHLKRAGAFRDGRVMSDPSQWPEIERMWTGRYFLRLELRNQVTRQHIQISWTHCHYGGWRPWLHCPFCNRRVLKLFRGMGGYFCRPCIGNPPMPVRRRARKAVLILRLASCACVLGVSPPLLPHFPSGHAECIGGLMRGCGVELRS
jgi:hypothetical protein